MQKRVTLLGFVLALLLLAAPAHGQGASCYPPPCGSSGHGSERTLVAVDAGAAPIPARVDRSPATVVAAGLLMVSLTFGLIAASRRSAIPRRGFRAEPAHRAVCIPRSTRPVAELSDVH